MKNIITPQHPASRESARVLNHHEDFEKHPENRLIRGSTDGMTNRSNENALTPKEHDMYKPGRTGRIAAMASAAALVLTLAITPPAAMAQAIPATTAEQSSTERGVTVKVTPTLIGVPGRAWEFSVVLDTHSADLNDDLMQSATLTTGDGRTLKPASWTGAAPGGHHREGVLSFEVPAPQPGTIELKIERPGESLPRIFRW